jgi:NADH-quinone oxidoreductase subunit C
MEEDPVLDILTQKFPDAVAERKTWKDERTAVVLREKLVEVCLFLRDDPRLSFNTIIDICGVDYLGEEPRYEVVYHLLSIPSARRIRLKVRVAGDDPRVPSVTSVWAGAEWPEREIYDMFGVAFEGHPDLRRILMPDDWQGHPLRKDYPLGGIEPWSERY